MQRYTFFILFACALASCGDHPYATDGHNNVQLPEGIESQSNSDHDSLVKEVPNTIEQEQ